MLGVIVALAWPTMVEQIMQTAVQYVATAMVGSLGPQATAAVGSTSTVSWLIISSISALSIGFLSFIARAYGANDKDAASKSVMQAVIVTLILGTILTGVIVIIHPYVPVWMNVDAAIVKLASTYFLIVYLPMLPRAATIMFGTVLRAAGDTKTPMKVGVMVNIINIILNFFLIYETRVISLFGMNIKVFGAGLGVVGAAIAGAIAVTYGGIRITMVMWKHPMVSPKGQPFKLDTNILLPCLKVALPNMIQRFATSFGFVMFASMINSLGYISTTAHTVANTVESAFYIPGNGMQTAASTLAGNAYGAKDKERMNALAKMFIPIEIGLMVISGAALFLFAKPLVGIFSDNAEVIALGNTVLKMVALSEPFYGFSIIVEGLLLGVGNTKLPFMYNVGCMWGIRIVGTFITTQILGYNLVAAWGCMIAHNMCLCMLYIRTYLSGRWNPLEWDPVAKKRISA
ncbi:MAG: MATE family efflux transporter [Eubacteriaceae bacterium]|nr:MATE family efflux transporter [Eubacteriaceae bacterium]